VPGETALVAAALLARQMHLQIELVIALAAFGAELAIASATSSAVPVGGAC
jgi:hypothetical protein